MSQTGAVIRRLLSKNNKLSGLNRSNHAINPSPRDNPKHRRNARIKGSHRIGNSSLNGAPNIRRTVGIRGSLSDISDSNINLRVRKTRRGVGIRKSKANLLDLSFFVIPQGTPLWEFPVFIP